MRPRSNQGLDIKLVGHVGDSNPGENSGKDKGSSSGKGLESKISKKVKNGRKMQNFKAGISLAMESESKP